MKVAFLDRDGVINKDTGYLHTIDDFVFTVDCVAGLQTLIDKGYALIIVTNQSGIGRGYYTEKDYQTLTQWYLNELSMKGVTVQAVYHCPHSPEMQCDCRKPQPGLFLQALEQYPSIDFTQSLMVGDKLSDLQAAQRVGIQTLALVDSDHHHDAHHASKTEGAKVSLYASLAEFAQLL